MRRLIILVLAFFFTISFIKAQDTEFWFGAPDDSYQYNACDRPTFIVISTTNEPARVQIQIGSGTIKTVDIAANSSHIERYTGTNVSLVENSIAAGVAGTVQNKGIHITSSAPVNAYYQVDGNCSKEIFSLKGKKALGTHFFTSFQTRYGPRSGYSDAYNHFVIVATHENTSIQIRSSATPGPNYPQNPGITPGAIIYRPSGGNVAVGSQYSITLNKGQTYVVRASTLRQGLQNSNWWALTQPSLAGTEVTSNHPIAITVAEPATAFGETSSSNPNPGIELLGDQIVPVEALGKHYIIPRGYGKEIYTGSGAAAEEWVYLMATEDNTTIWGNYNTSVSGVPVSHVTINKGQHWSCLYTSDPRMTGFYFTSDKPIYCYHQSAHAKEMGAAMIPSMYSISARKLTFYRQLTGLTGTKLFLIFRTGAHNGFTINGTIFNINTNDVISIPGVNDWVYARVDLPSSVPEGQCVIENSKSAFAMGLFAYTTATTTTYGFLSNFGSFSFDEDTTYKCKDESVLLDGGYALAYDWTLPDGSHLKTPTINATAEGLYKVVINQDGTYITDSIYVKNRFSDISIKGPDANIFGTPQKYYVDLGGEYSAHAMFEWTVNGSASYPAYSTDTVYYTWTDNDPKTIIVDISDEELGCDTTIYMTVGAALLAEKDTSSVMLNTSVIIDVLRNDLLGICERGSSLETGVVTDAGKGPSHGTVVLNADSTITYINTDSYLGSDTFHYYIKCGASYDTAQVFVKIVVRPDNISDVDCYADPPETLWDIELKRNSNVPVHYLATPFAGDLDKDGRIEVVTAGVSSNFMSNKVLIFNDSLRLIRTINLQYNSPQHFTTNLLIADVDNDGFGDIVVGTVNNTLLCYSHLGVKKWGPTTAFTAGSTGGVHYCPSLIISDINGDGYSEILAGDKLYDATTGNLLLTLPQGGRGFSSSGPESYMPVFADIDNDGVQEIVAGNTVYKAVINNRAGTSQNSISVFRQMPASFPDGFTSVADIDMDGDLDVIVTAGSTGNHAIMYVWDGATTTQIGKTITVNSVDNRISRAFVGDITGNGRPDIAFTYTRRIEAYRYDVATGNFINIFSEPTTDNSGATTMSMFDFDQNGEVELVYRDQDNLRIINKSGINIASIPSFSGTHTEYPIVVDLDKDGHADILVTGALNSATGDIYEANTYIMHFGSITPKQWASARSVWNQHAYNAVNINEDLTVPAKQFNPAMALSGNDGIIGTVDDVRPYNNFLQQQTILSMNGLPIWPTPDVILNASSSSMTISGNDIIINACFSNMGDASIGSPIFATVYSNSILSANILAMDSANIQVGIGGTGCVTIKIPKSALPSPMPNRFFVRVNDRNNKFAFYAECDSSNNVIDYVNPLLMRKDATLMILPDFKHNGTYPNPVSVLFNEEIMYEITAVNANKAAGSIVITDTIPAYMRYVSNTSSATPPANTFNSNAITFNSVNYDVVNWTFANVQPADSVKVSFYATPVSGVNASQPLFINRAWVKLDGEIQIATNNTYHQGAGVSITTFSAGQGGNIYNAAEQALDYMTTPSSGVIVVPEEGYRFAGWSHGDYASLRGALVEAQEGIMYYDTLTVYGNVDLHASFEPEVYPIEYYLNGGENAKNNPEKYTIKSETIVIEAPVMNGDTFIGWTGSNADEPQQSVVVAKGSTGKLTFYANFLISGRENIEADTSDNKDKVWAVEDNLYLRIKKAGSVVRIYSLDGVLREQRTVFTPDTVVMKLSRGIYIVTINNNTGKKIKIE